MSTNGAVTYRVLKELSPTICNRNYKFIRPAAMKLGEISKKILKE